MLVNFGWDGKSKSKYNKITIVSMSEEAKRPIASLKLLSVTNLLDVTSSVPSRLLSTRELTSKEKKRNIYV